MAKVVTAGAGGGRPRARVWVLVLLMAALWGAAHLAIGKPPAGRIKVGEKIFDLELVEVQPEALDVGVYLRGQVYELDKPIRLGSGARIIDSGDAKLPRPVLKWVGAREGGPIVQVTDGAEDVLIQGVELATKFSEPPYDQDVPQAIRLGAAKGITIRDVGFLDVGYAINGNGWPSGVLVEDCQSLSETGLRGYFAWVQGSDWTLRNNRVANSTREHVVRLVGASNITITGNDFANLDRTAAGDKADTSKGCITAQWGQDYLILDNVIRGGPGGGGIGIGPLAGPDGRQGEINRLTRKGFTAEQIEVALNTDPDGTVQTRGVKVIGNRFVASQVQVHAGSHDVEIASNEIDRLGGLCIQVTCADPLIPSRRISNITIRGNRMSMAADRQNFFRVIGADSPWAIGQISYYGNVHLGHLIPPYGYAAKIEGKTLAALAVPLSKNIWPAGAAVQMSGGVQPIE